VATAWERALNESITPNTRKVIMRSAMVMSTDHGGVFDTLLALARFGLGGSAGDGRQYVSWVHDQDFIRAVYWLIEHDELEGPINIAAPNPIPNSEFMSALRSAAGIHFGLPATPLMLEAGAFFLRTETELILKSRRVTPGKLKQAKFIFQFPTWAEAAQDLCDRSRNTR
jgi:NAD dependent epimerase/dehydratase family enzyme